MNSPEGEDLTGFLHGHPGTDETGDQTAGAEGRTGRTGDNRGERKIGEMVKTEMEDRQSR